jgi:hypothetical protein
MQAIEQIKQRNKKGLIYKIILGDKFIIGSTINYKERVYHHKYCLINNKHCNKPLQSIYNKLDNKNISFEILQEDIPEIILQYVEDIWIGASCSKIQDKKQGLNIIDGSRISYTKEMIEHKRIIQTEKMKNLSVEDKKQIYIKGQLTKKVKIIEIGKNISKGRKNNAKFNWDNNQTKPVTQLTKDDIVINTWSSAYQVQKELGFSSSKISAVCRNKYNLKTHNNYKWRFSTIEEIENAKGRNNKKG